MPEQTVIQLTESSLPEVPDKFDRYREALVVETATDWPPAMRDIGSCHNAMRSSRKLHADAAACSQLEYIRVPTGFCRKITVTAEDIERVK